MIVERANLSWHFAKDQIIAFGLNFRIMKGRVLIWKCRNTTYQNAVSKEQKSRREEILRQRSANNIVNEGISDHRLDVTIKRTLEFGRHLGIIA